MKKNEILIDRLRHETGFNYGMCEKALLKNKNDYKLAKRYLLEYENKPFVKLYQNITYFISGNKKFMLRMTRYEEEIFNVNLIFPILFLLIFPVSSLIIAFLLIIIILFDLEMYVNIVDMNDNRNEILKKEVKKIKNNKKEKQVAQILSEEDGFNVITIR